MTLIQCNISVIRKLATARASINISVVISTGKQKFEKEHSNKPSNNNKNDFSEQGSNLRPNDYHPLILFKCALRVSSENCCRVQSISKIANHVQVILAFPSDWLKAKRCKSATISTHYHIEKKIK